MSTTNLLQFDRAGLVGWFEAHGEKAFRARQVFRWMHQKGATDFSGMSDLAKPLRAWLEQEARIEGLLTLTEQRSRDGTVKWLFDVGNGDAVETVFIPEAQRNTLCVSTQAGCAMACRFCSTGAQGFSRNLTSAEILAQLWQAEFSMRQALGLAPGERAISNVVMMGMGEPLQNYGALVPALRAMLDDDGYGLSRRRVTVSTAGMVRMIDRLASDCPVALAVSLHAPNDALRDDLVPLNRKYPLAELLAACERYLAHAPRDFITFEYCMLDGVNDLPEHAQQLVGLLRDRFPCKFNLIPFNPFLQSGLKRSPTHRITAFAQTLMDAGFVTTVRKTRGDDIDAACGQLAGDVQDRTSRKLTRPGAPVIAPGQPIIPIRIDVGSSANRSSNLI